LARELWRRKQHETSSFIFNRLWSRMYDVARSRAPDVLIGKEDDTYMERWWVIPRNRVFISICTTSCAPTMIELCTAIHGGTCRFFSMANIPNTRLLRAEFTIAKNI